jgi:hypothetical protein
VTVISLAAALANRAAGICPLEAAAALLIAECTFLCRCDFTSRFIEHGTSQGIPMAAIDWDAAISALYVGELACSAGRAPHSLRSGEHRRRHPGRPPRRRHRPRRPQRPAAHRRHQPRRPTAAGPQCLPKSAVAPLVLVVAHIYVCGALGVALALSPLRALESRATENPGRIALGRRVRGPPVFSKLDTTPGRRLRTGFCRCDSRLPGATPAIPAAPEIGDAW